MESLKHNQRLASLPWRNILTSLEDGVIIVDRNGVVRFVNQAGEDLLRTSALQLLDRAYEETFPQNPWINSMIARSLGSDEASSRGEGDLNGVRKARTPVNVVVTPFHDDQGAALGSVVILRDRTLQCQMEEDLKRSDRLALLGTLAAGLAHEIKNPLGGIKGAAQLLRQDVSHDPSLVENTDIMIREVDRVNELMERLLDLARPAKLQLEPLNIHELMQQVLFLEMRSQGASEVRVVRNFDPSLPHVMGDRTRLIQVFLNLIKNAVQALPEGKGQVTLTTRMDTDLYVRAQPEARAQFVRIEIQDNGAGIQEEDLPHIFSPFFTTRQNGTGFGLSICHRVIQEHGGRIRVESRQGQGSVFRVSLPIAS